MAANITTVTFSLTSGNYTGTQSTTLACTGANNIFYTTDGTTPAESGGTATGTTHTITGTSGVVSISATVGIMAFSYVSADSPTDGPITGAAYGIEAPAAAGTVVLSTTTSNILQSLLTDSIQAGYAANPFTAQQSSDLQTALAELRNNV